MSTEVLVTEGRDSQGNMVQKLTNIPVGPAYITGAGLYDNAGWDTYTQPQPAGVGPLDARRTYDGISQGGVGGTGVPASISNTRAYPDVAAGRTSLHTFKPDFLDGYAIGSLNAALTAYWNTINHPYIGGTHHEPEDNIQNGEYTLAQWLQGNVHAGTTMKNTGKTNLRFSINLRGFRTAYSYGGFEQFWTPAFADVVDYIFFDPYYERFAGIPQTFASYIQSSLDWARSKGKRVGLAEWGIVNTKTDSQRRDFVLEVDAWAKANEDVDYLCYWPNVLGANDYTPYPTSSWPLFHGALRDMASYGQMP